MRLSAQVSQLWSYKIKLSVKATATATITITTTLSATGAARSIVMTSNNNNSNNKRTTHMSYCNVAGVVDIFVVVVVVCGLVRILLLADPTLRIIQDIHIATGNFNEGSYKSTEFGVFKTHQKN